MVEFIGFLISLVAILFLFFKGHHDARQRKKNPPYDLQEEDFHEDDPIREILKVMEGQRGRPLAPPQPKALPANKNSFLAKPQKYTGLEGLQLRAQQEEHKQKSALESRRLASQLAQRKVKPPMATNDFLQALERPPPRGAKLFKAMGGLRQMILAHEILSPPLALRNRDIPE